MKKVIVMGQGYVGLPLAMAAAGAGHEVVGFETDEGRLSQLSAGHSCVQDVTDDELRKHLASDAYYATAFPPALKGFDVAVITVPTPVKERILNQDYIRETARTVGLALREGGLVVLESTAPPGTTRDVVIPALEETSLLASGDHFHVAFSPERLTAEPSVKIVGGYNMACRQVAALFYRGLTSSVTLAQTLEEAETLSMAGSRP